MKKSAILFLVVFISISSFAQCFNYTANYQERWQAVYSQYGIVSRGVNVIAQYSCDIDTNLSVKNSTYYKYKKGIKPDIPKSSREYKYSNGRLISYMYTQKQKLKTHYNLTYNESGYYTSYKYIKNEKLHLGEDVTYNNSNKVVELIRYNKKNEVDQKETYRYNDQQWLMEKEFFSKKMDVPTSAYKYEYYTDGQKKQAEYFRKGELKSRWLYTCDDEGKKVQIDSVKVNLVCSITEHNNDSTYVKVNRTTDSKGNVSKYRWSYNKKGELIAYEYANHKGKITRKYTQEFDDKGNRIKYTSYKRGGEKISYFSKYKFNDNRKVIERSLHKADGTLKSKVLYRFNSQGQMLEQTRINSKNRMEDKWTYTYDDKGNESSRVVYNKNNVPVKEFNYTYTY